MDEFDLGLAKLAPVPSGSLILIASHHIVWRDHVLAAVAFSLANEGNELSFFALAENIEVPKRRFESFTHETYSTWAYKNAALHESRVSSGDAVGGCNKQVNQLPDRDARARVEFAALYENLAEVEFTSPDESDFDGVAEAIQQAVDEEGRRVCIVDDISAIRRDARKPGSAKLCGEHARALKDLAIDLDIVVVAGMQTPHVTDRRQRAHWMDSDPEKLLELSDLSGYGAPHESCDALITASPEYRLDDERKLKPHVAIARYGLKR